MRDSFNTTSTTAWKDGGNTSRAKSNMQKQATSGLYEGVETPILDKLTKINSKARTLLLEVFGEFERNVNLNFTRIYPASGSD